MPLTRSQIYVRRRIAVFGALGALFAAGLYLPFTLLAPIDAVTASVEPFSATVAAPAEISMPSYGASSIGAVGFADDLATGGTEKALPIASITKVITSLVVLDRHPILEKDPGPEITFDAADVAIYRSFLASNGKVSPVSVGLTLTQREVVELVLIESANNYAASLSAWAFGSEKDFLAAAAAWLQSHGLDNTTLADSSGMSPHNVSTAVDLVKLGKIALEDPVISSIVATKTTTIPGIGNIENTNELLGIAGVMGIKTGTLDEAGACLLFASDVVVGEETVVVVGAVLGATTHDQLNARVRTLLTQAAAGFTVVELSALGQSFATFSTPWGTQSEAVTTEAISAVVWSDTPALVFVKLKDVALAERKSTAGEVVFTVGERTIRSTLVLETAIEDPGVWWRLTNPVELL